MNHRLRSLDAFRGFTIAAMVLVNNPGDWGNLYPQLAHAKWHGWTFTDTIFPFFLFIGGVAMALSLGRLAAAGVDKPMLLRKLALRALLIFGIGFLLNLVPHFNWAAVRIPGVLQRIALCTVLAAPLVVYGGVRLQLLAIVVLLAGYAALMLGVDVPGIGAGVLEPGKDLGACLDRALLGPHLWVQAKTWDPEGLLSTLPALASTLIGVLCGRALLGPAAPAEKTIAMLLTGLLLLALGSTFDAILMPINKSLWTPSFCLWMSGWALLAFGAFYWLLDGATNPRVRAIATRWSTPLVIYGMNALFIFALSGLIAKMLGFIKLTAADGSQLSLGKALYAPVKALELAPVNTSLLYALLFNAFMFCIAYGLWRKKWFVKV
ncbi:acyltransferase family protein [Massilia sp. DWR3-1-1]|uniref:acyltransferase family protein n=1 Tax=Massilia sp. DWR3-1-1 TaxID=2804559 RepID=UPI003CF28392